MRQTSASRGVSPSTVFKAYLLEARGLIRARDRSGYYVLRARREYAAGTGGRLQRRCRPPSGGCQRQGATGAQRHPAARHAALRLGLSQSSLLPYGRLARVHGVDGAKLDPWGSIDDLSPGDAALRRAIALRYLADGLTVPVDDIIITNGALDALNLCLSAVTRPGDAVIVESPTFYAALQSLERNQLHAIEVATHPREGHRPGRAGPGHRAPQAARLLADDHLPEPLGSLMPDARRKRWSSC